MLRYFSTSEDAVVAHVRPDIAFTELIFQHAACTELISQHVTFTGGKLAKVVKDLALSYESELL